MKRILVIGLGNFGTVLAEQLHEQGHEVVAVDERPDVIDAIGPRVSRALVGDATKRVVLEEAGAPQADAAVVSTGDDLAASVLTLLALRDIGVSSVFVKVHSAEHARIANALGAEESVFPEHESALALASRISARTPLLKYVQLGKELSLQEMAVPAEWNGKTLRELGLPQRYHAQVVAVHDVLRDAMMPVPDPDRPLTLSDALLVAGSPAVLEQLARLS